MSHRPRERYNDKVPSSNQTQSFGTAMNSTKPPQTPVTPCFPEQQQDDMCWSTTVTVADNDNDDDSLSSPPQQQQPAAAAAAATATKTATTTTQQIFPPAPPPPPHKSRRSKLRRTVLRRRFAGMARPLAPLLSIETGLAHPRFPPTLLHYHLLTEAELESLARFYHQSEPSRFSMEYPMPVVARWRTPPAPPPPASARRADDDDHDGMDVDVDVDVDVETAEVKRLRAILQMPRGEADLECWRALQDKRRRFGRFMGLQGMESATAEGEVSMREEMERWVNAELARKEARETELEAWRSKGYW